MPDVLCDELIDYFNYNQKYLKEGVVGKGSNRNVFDKEEKESLELMISSGNLDGVIGVYRKYLQEVLNNYLTKYERADMVCDFNINHAYNFQMYPKSGGFKKWHCENSGPSSMHRHLVFMTYLNDVADGGTEFMYQNIKTKAEKGLTLIWPTIWTHTHKGVVSHTKEKYIITGWYSFS